MNRSTCSLPCIVIGTFIAMALCVAGPAAPAQARAGKPKVHTLALETMGTEGSPWHRMFKLFAQRITKESGGRIVVKGRFDSPAGENEIVKRCIDGTIQACGVTIGALSTRVKDLAVLELPYLFLDVGEVDRILGGPALPQVKAILAAHGLSFYCWSENGWRSFGTKEIAIRKPEDLQGLKMRAMEGNRYHNALYEALKARPVSLNLPDVVAALEHDVVVGFDQSPMYLTAASWQKQIKYFTLTRHIFQPAVVAFNKKWFDALPADLQQMILKLAAELERFGRKEFRAIEEQLIQMIESEGVKVIRLTPAQRVPFVVATKAAHLKVYKLLSPRARKLLDAIYKAKQR